jgi:hypothetical protein
MAVAGGFGVTLLVLGGCCGPGDLEAERFDASGDA